MEGVVVVEPAVRHPVVRIDVRIQVGSNLMSGTDDPLFLGIRGSSGREFRLRPARGFSLRRGQEDRLVFGDPRDPATNVDHPELNDPTQPPLDAGAIEALYLRKGLEPIPNVRALGEMDDRLEIAAVEVEITAEGRARALRYARSGPIWLGLVCGFSLDIPRVDERV